MGMSEKNIKIGRAARTRDASKYFKGAIEFSLINIFRIKNTLSFRMRNIYKNTREYLMFLMVSPLAFIIMVGFFLAALLTGRVQMTIRK